MQQFNHSVIRSILSMKLKYSWKEIAAALNEDFQTTLTGEAVRKRVQRYRRNNPVRYIYIRLVVKAIALYSMNE
jgi:hypothetical protein